MRITNATDDDLKVLLAKKYVLNFENKVLVIRDWKVNNFIRPDRYTPTIYLEYLKRLELTNSNQYQLTSGIPEDIPKVGIGKDRLELGKDRLGKDSVGEKTPSQKANDFFKNIELQEEVVIFLKDKGINEEICRREINKFVSYWTELNKSGTKQRWNLEKTFEIDKRLTTWFNRIKEFQGKVVDKSKIKSVRV